MLKLTDEKRKKLKKVLIIIFVIYIFSLCFTMSIKTDYNSAPDEEMKYDVCRYIYNNSKLPHGGDESIRDEKYGISYAFTPILSYIISAVFMRIFDVFSNDFFTLVTSARFVSVLCITGYAYMCIKISEKLFKGIYRWLFVAFCTLLPQLLYLGSYINNDSFALLTISIIIYAWLLGMETQWNWKSCIILGIGIGLCMMAYYNAYGYILTSMIIYFVSCYIKKVNFKEFLKKGFSIAGIAFLIAGWWFIRSFIIYDGDFLGINIQREYAQEYAIEELKPTNRVTPANQGYSLKYMLKDMYWLKITKSSFIGHFGWVSVMMKPNIYTIYETIAQIGLIGIVLGILIDIIKATTKNKKQIMENEIKVKKEKILLHIIFISNIIITIGLSIYYSYYMDFQPQGRYIMPMVIPFMYYLVLGIKNIFDIIVKNEKIKNIVLTILILILIIMATCISYEYVVKVL